MQGKKDGEKTKEELIRDLNALRKQVRALKKAGGGTAGEGVKHPPDQLQDLLMISRVISATTDLRKLYRKIVSISKKLLNLDFSTLMIFSDDKTRLVMEDTIGFPKSHRGTFSLLEGQGLSTYVAKYKKANTVADFKKETRFEVPRDVPDHNISSAICVPMMFQNEVLGVLIGHVHKKRKFTDHEVSLYQNIASQAAIAIKNSMQLMALERSEELFRDLFDNATDLIQRVSPEGAFLLTNKAWRNTLGYTEKELKNMKVFDIIHAGDHCHCEERLKKVLHGETLSNVELRFVTKDGRTITVEGNVNCNFQDGKPVATRGIFRDITERKRMEESIRYQACHDLLTGLPNRTLFADRLNTALTHVHRNNKVLAILFLDLDAFKIVNDTLGHTVGDLLLKEVSSRLKKCVRESDTIARFGGDEFIMLVADINAAEDASIIARKVLQIFEEPYVVEGNTFNITTSIGISVYPDDGDNAEELLKHADSAMYRAKKQGRNNFQFYGAGVKSS